MHAAMEVFAKKVEQFEDLTIPCLSYAGKI